MRKAERLWMVLLCYAASVVPLFVVYEKYLRGYVLQVTSSQSSLRPEGSDTATRNFWADRSRKAFAKDGGSLPHSSKKNKPHFCTLPGNRTAKLVEAPKLILAGAQKAGTSAFYFLLKKHPYMVPSRKFESHFFDWEFAVPPRDLKNPSFWTKFNATTEDELLCAARQQYISENFRVDQLLKSPTPSITYEKTPNYMFLPQVPELIYNICPWNPKIVLILRNPVDRAYSHYSMDSNKLRIDKTFEEYIQLELNTMRKEGLTTVPILSENWDPNDSSSDYNFNNPPDHMNQEELDHAHWMVYRKRHMRNYLQRGIYNVQVERWVKFFPLNESLMVINNERLQQEPRKVMGEVLKFLGAPQPDFFDDESVSVSLSERSLHQKTGGLLSVGGYEAMNTTTRIFLEKFYRPYNEKIVEVLGDSWKGVWDKQRVP